MIDILIFVIQCSLEITLYRHTNKMYEKKLEEINKFRFFSPKITKL